ncbi:uncharacterized protein LOC108136193 [Drosophila elegans]|uniref:uncharacterized protein LOC108136193 n=1 Tax=Drosophila elegans TaxID=30023 RepID=UPI0007E7BE3A|nr:uncharacterized protein LOC108136193 [Drosophila elegans]
MNKENLKDDERETFKKLVPIGNEEIAKKLNEINEQKSHANEIAKVLEYLVSHTNSKSMPLTVSDQELRENVVTDAAENSEKPNYSQDEEKPSESAAARMINDEAINPAKDENDNELIYVDSEVNMFILQPDGNHELYTVHPPKYKEEQRVDMHEIVIEDGEIILLTGGNGEVVYNPDDTVAIDISDSRIFVVDAQESEDCIMQSSGDHDMKEYLLDSNS